MLNIMFTNISTKCRRVLVLLVILKQIFGMLTLDFRDMTLTSPRVRRSVTPKVISIPQWEHRPQGAILKGGIIQSLDMML